MLPREKRRSRGRLRPVNSFQSAPGCYPGRNVRVPLCPRPIVVSIRSRVLPREKRRRDGQRERLRTVSIRSRVLPREKRWGGLDLASTTDMFQSAPGCYPGRNKPKRLSPCSPLLFQSAPGCYPGRNDPPADRIAGIYPFQSAPGCYPGRNSVVVSFAVNDGSFNPLPGVTPGETSLQQLTISRMLQFQSAPGCYPGRNG